MKKIAIAGSIATAAFLSACSTAPIKHTADPVAPAAQVVSVPANLKAPAGEVLAFQMAATGVQIYDCRANKSGPKKFEWVFRAPEAELYASHDPTSPKLGKHYEGPTWEAADGSKVVAEVVAKSDSVDTSAIPWLLLKAKSSSANGTFSKVTSIQRVVTVGGKAPLTGCSDFQIGAETRTPYKATYYFFKAN
ncbi:DUF3455 domain-containing protein [Undibacterium sp. Tian12W]|uniref:DUF3455 domain-containing protein n=1 Tax=Undibacterium sp. Tian12W TaxID=3413054 RepID=UPI003BF3213D